MEKFVDADSRTRPERDEVDLSWLLLDIQMELLRFTSSFHQGYPIDGPFAHILSFENLLLICGASH